jgi:hypothetical protein
MNARSSSDREIACQDRRADIDFRQFCAINAEAAQTVAGTRFEVGIVEDWLT